MTMQMQLRTHITRPQRYEDSPDPPEHRRRSSNTHIHPPSHTQSHSHSHSSSHAASTAAAEMPPKDKELRSKAVKPKPTFMDYDPDLPPACFPTLAEVVPRGDVGGMGIGSEDEDEDGDGDSGDEGGGEDDDGDGEDNGDGDEEMVGHDMGEPIQEKVQMEHLGGENDSEGVEAARDLGNGEDSVDSVEESSLAVEVGGRYLEGAAAALRDIAKSMSPDRMLPSMEGETEWSTSTGGTPQGPNGEQIRDGGHDEAANGAVGEGAGYLNVLVQGLQEAAKTTEIPETGHVHQPMEMPVAVGDAVTPPTWEDVDQIVMFPSPRVQQSPTPATEISGPTSWRDLTISLRTEILANAIHECYDMEIFCDNLEIDEKAFQQTSVWLNERTKNLRNEEILLCQSHLESRAVFTTPGWIENQYYKRFGNNPTALQKSLFEQQQFHGHIMTAVDKCIQRDKNNPQFRQFDQMFHCKQSELRTAQKFLKDHNYDARLAGEGWTGGEKAALETVLKLDGLFDPKNKKSKKKKDLQKVRRLAESIGVDLDLDSAPEMIDLLDGPFISTGEYAHPLHLDSSVTRVPNPLVRSSSSSSTDSEAERRVSIGKLVKLKLPTLALRKLRDGVCAAQTAWNLPERNLARRPRGFSPPRWHGRAAPAKARKRGRSATPRKIMPEENVQPESGHHSVKEKTAAVSGVQGSGRAIKLKIRVPDGLRDELVAGSPATETLSGVTLTNEASTQMTAAAPAMSLTNVIGLNSVVSTPTTSAETAKLKASPDFQVVIHHGPARQQNLGFQVDTQASQSLLSRLGHDPVPPTPEPLTARIPEFPFTDTAAIPTGTLQGPPLSPGTTHRAVLSLLDKLQSRQGTPPTPSYELITPETISPPPAAGNPPHLPNTNLLETAAGHHQPQPQISGEGSLITPVSAFMEKPDQGLPIQAQELSTVVGLGTLIPPLEDQVPTPMRPTTPMSSAASADFQTRRTENTPSAVLEKRKIQVISAIPEQAEQDSTPAPTMDEDEDILVGIEDPHGPGRGKLPVPRQLERLRSQSVRRGKLRLSAPRPPSENLSKLATPGAFKSELDTGERATSISSFAPTDGESSSANNMTDNDKAKPNAKKGKAPAKKKATKAKPTGVATPVGPATPATSVAYSPPKTRKTSSNAVPNETPTESAPKKITPKKITPKKAAPVMPPPGESATAEKSSVAPAAKRRSSRTNISTATPAIPPSSAEATPTPLSTVGRPGGTSRKTKTTLATQAPQNTPSLDISTADVLPESSQPAAGHKRRISLIVKDQTDTPDPAPPAKKPRLRKPTKANPGPLPSEAIPSTVQDHSSLIPGEVAPSSTPQNQAGPKPRTRAYTLAHNVDGSAETVDLPTDSEASPLPTQATPNILPKPKKSAKNETPKPPANTPLTRSVAKAPIHNLRSVSVGITPAPAAKPNKRARVSSATTAKKEKATPQPAEPTAAKDPSETPTPSKKFGWGGRRIAGTGQGNHNYRKKSQKRPEA